MLFCVSYMFCHCWLTDLHTLIDWIFLATSTLVLPFTDWPLTPTSSSPDCNVPSLDAGVLSKICTTYRQGHSGAPPPILIPIRFFSSFVKDTDPEETVIPLKKDNKIIHGILIASCIKQERMKKMIPWNSPHKIMYPPNWKQKILIAKQC